MTLFYNHHPTRSKELQILKILNQRMTFPPKSRTRFYNLQKGYEGEVNFHKLLKEHLRSDCIVLYDLLLDSNGSEFQLDCIIIQEHNIWHLEIKNFSGDYQLTDNKLYSVASKKEVNNPFIQLERSKFLLGQSLDRLGFNLQLNSYVIFVNPEFTLYGSKASFPIIHPTQIIRFIKNLNTSPSILNKSHYNLASKLFHKQVPEEPYKRLPSYEYEQLNKGVRCPDCNGYLAPHGIHGKSYTCTKCGSREGRNSVVLRNAVEFNLLFPDRKITTKAIYDLCGGIISTYKIRKAALQFMQPMGGKRYKHFIFPFQK